MKKITIYATATCGYCHMLKNYLDGKKVQYEVKKADEDPKLAQELYEKSGQLGVPFTVITDEHGKETNILGFDKVTIDHVLAL